MAELHEMRFEFATARRIVFGPRLAEKLPAITAGFAGRVFVVLGATPERFGSLLGEMTAQGVEYETFGVAGEPTVETAQSAVASARAVGADAVVAIGGGSVIDTGKVVAAMLTNEGDLLDYLEVVGAGEPLEHGSAPFVAVPTTAGTGAEVTSNAVLSVPEHRVKVSMRSPFMLPQVALVDPVLTHSMPPELTASTGLDALTQLIEVFVSSKANPLTDGICREGLVRAGRSLQRVFLDGRDVEARRDMVLASLFSGLGLANAKLGAVHGFAGPVGGLIGAPHGVICGKLLPYVMETNVRALRDRAPDSPVLGRFDEVARLLTGEERAGASEAVTWIHALCETLRLPGLRNYGLTDDVMPVAVEKARKASSMKGNPVELTVAELSGILTAAID